MKADELAVERAAWAVSLKAEFSNRGYKVRGHLNDFQTFLMLSHDQSPGWHAKFTLNSKTRNRIELDGEKVANNCHAATRQILVGMVEKIRFAHDAKISSKRENELKAAQWMQRQSDECAELNELPGIDFEIVRSGPHTGCYQVTLQPGNALEHLTLDQLKVFHAFAKGLQ